MALLDSTTATTADFGIRCDAASAENWESNPCGLSFQGEKRDHKLGDCATSVPPSSTAAMAGSSCTQPAESRRDWQSRPLTRSLPSGHKFWSRINGVLYGAAATAAAADFWTTRHAVSHGGRELNPLARPFAGSDALFAAYKVGSVGSYLGLSYLFHRKGWHKLERFVPVIAIAADSTAAVLNRKRSF